MRLEQPHRVAQEAGTPPGRTAVGLQFDGYLEAAGQSGSEADGSRFVGRCVDREVVTMPPGADHPR